MQRRCKETMCAANIGDNGNFGELIPSDKPTRDLQGVLKANPSKTALTDEEIWELSKNNEDAITSADDNPEFYYRIELCGDFSLNNVCYSIIKPCRCVVTGTDNGIVIKTSRFVRLNSIARLVVKLKEDVIHSVTLYKIFPSGETEIIEEIRTIDDLCVFFKIGMHYVVEKPCVKSQYEIEMENRQNQITAERYYQENIVRYMCPHCFEEKGVCKCANMKKYSYIEIDENMFDIVRTLNKKGYRTTYCCEGHPCGTYLNFACGVRFPFFPKYADVRMKYIHTTMAYGYLDPLVKKYHYSFEDEKAKALHYFREWAESLPEVSQVNESEFISGNPKKYQVYAKDIKKEDFIKILGAKEE